MQETILTLVTDFFNSLLINGPIFLIALTFHEFAHAFVSYKLGDPSAKAEGRLTLNPLKHIDPLGLIFLLIFQVGWAKPVPVRLQWFRHPKRDMALTALAGAVMNFILAVVSIPFAVIIMYFYFKNYDNMLLEYLYQFIFGFIISNIVLGVFNLIPIPPLDGSRVLTSILPDRYYYKIMNFEQYGFILVIILVIIDNRLGFLSWFFSLFYTPVLNLIQTIAIQLLMLF